MPDISGMTQADLRARAAQLRSVMSALVGGELQASSRERAFIAGALRTVELMQADLEAVPVEPGPSDRRTGKAS